MCDRRVMRDSQSAAKFRGLNNRSCGNFFSDIAIRDDGSGRGYARGIELLPAEQHNCRDERHEHGYMAM